MKKQFTILLCILLILTGSVSAIDFTSTTTLLKGSILYVGGSGPGNYTRIQDAINDSSEGDTVFVFAGVYYENMITVNKSINLIGEDKNLTCIDGENKNPIIILITSSGVTISHFLLKNCYYTNDLGQAIYLWGNNTYLEDIHIRDCIIQQCDKGIFFINTTDLIIQNCQISYARGPTTWGYTGNSHTIIRDCIAHNNGVDLGGGWIIPGSFRFDTTYSDICIRNCIIHDVIGPGIYFHGDGDKVELFQNTIYQNSWEGIRIYANFPGITNVNLQNNSVYENDIRGIFLSGIDYPGVSIVHNNISFNGHGEELRDGGICLQDCANYSVNITDNIISSNNGAGICPIGIPGIKIIKNDIIKNSYKGIHLHASKDALIQGNSIVENNEGICLDFDSAIVSGNIISGNKIGINISRSNNVIHHNEISNNDEGINLLGYGFYQGQGNDNLIMANNFRGNKRTVFFEYYYDLFDPMEISFKGNYWERFRILPKPVFGQLRLLSNWLKDPLRMPWMVWDLTPAKIPNTVTEDYCNYQHSKHLSGDTDGGDVHTYWVEQDNIFRCNSPPLVVKKVKFFEQELYDWGDNT